MLINVHDNHYHIAYNNNTRQPDLKGIDQSMIHLCDEL